MFSSNGLTVMTLLALLLIGAVLGLQLAEHSYYAAVPSLWP